MLNNTSFNTILQTQTTNTRTSNFTNYNSKTQFKNSTHFESLNTNVQNFITQLKNCFSFSIHNSMLYVIITMYFTNTKSYSFYVVNCTQNTVTQFNSIKESKQYVLNNINTVTNTKSTNK